MVCHIRVVFSVFFFKQKTAYEMRISDWSSDVCSSDLAVIVARENRSGSGDVRARIEHIVPGQTQGLHVAGVDLATAAINRVTLADIVTSERHRLLTACRADLATETFDVRSEGRRVGKVCVWSCRSRWSSSHKTNKNK